MQTLIDGAAPGRGARSATAAGACCRSPCTGSGGAARRPDRDRQLGLVPVRLGAADRGQPVRPGRRAAQRRRPAALAAAHRDDHRRARSRPAAQISTLGPGHWQVAPGKLDLPDQVIEPDLSNAAPFLAAALVTGGSVTVPHWPADHRPSPGRCWPNCSPHGRDRQPRTGGLTVTGTGAIGPLVADLHEASELTPVLAALAALADGESRISGVAHIRGHETDRLAALRTELAAARRRGHRDRGRPGDPARRRCGRPPGTPTPTTGWPRPARCSGWRCAGLTVDDIGCTSKTLADFPGLWAGLLGASRAEHGAARHQPAGRGRRPQPAHPLRQPGPHQAAAGACRCRRPAW